MMRFRSLFEKIAAAEGVVLPIFAAGADAAEPLICALANAGLSDGATLELSPRAIIIRIRRRPPLVLSRAGRWSLGAREGDGLVFGLAKFMRLSAPAMADRLLIAREARQ